MLIFNKKYRFINYDYGHSAIVEFIEVHTLQIHSLRIHIPKSRHSEFVFKVLDDYGQNKINQEYLTLYQHHVDSMISNLDYLKNDIYDS